MGCPASASPQEDSSNRGRSPLPKGKLLPQRGELGQDTPTSPQKCSEQNQTFELPLRSADLVGEARWGSPKRCCCLVAKLCSTLRDPMDHSPPGSSIHGILQARYWSGLPCPPPGDLPGPEIELASLYVSTLASGFFTTRAIWEAHMLLYICSNQ